MKKGIASTINNNLKMYKGRKLLLIIKNANSIYLRDICHTVIDVRGTGAALMKVGAIFRRNLDAYQIKIIDMDTHRLLFTITV